ncbi:MAG: hypothetical protein AAF916_11870 [Planctomycetota bacterium]
MSIEEGHISRRPLASNMRLNRCKISGGSLDGAVVEDVLVDGLETGGLFQTWATVFKHVTLRGKIDGLMLSDLFRPSYPTSEFQTEMDRANAAYYAEVDWALDISEAEFQDEFDCRGVPSRLIRRDPETQIMVTRKRLIECGDAISAGGDFWRMMLRLFLKNDRYDDTVLIAWKRNKDFKELSAGIRALRAAGVTEDD